MWGLKRDQVEIHDEYARHPAPGPHPPLKFFRVSVRVPIFSGEYCKIPEKMEIGDIFLKIHTREGDIYFEKLGTSSGPP
jgi:hypothetical protein